MLSKCNGDGGMVPPAIDFLKFLYYFGIFEVFILFWNF
jgi:hypothetical protein